MPKPSFQDQIATLRNELELSTFLNKGVLQSNSEYKLRIAELESENAVLRKAESRLADTEDELESAQKRIRQLESTLRAAEERRAAAIAREQDARVAAECERDRFRAKHDTLRAALAELLGAASEESPPGYSTTTESSKGDRGRLRSSRSERSLGAVSAAAADLDADPLADDLEDEFGAESASQSPRVKRRRGHDRDDEEDDDDLEERRPISSPIRRPPRPPTPKFQSASVPRRKGRPVKTETPSKGRRRRTEVKLEPESDTDPLAM